MQRTVVFETWRDLENCRSDWLELLNGAATGTVFQSPEWVLGWWQVVQPGSQLLCVALYDDGQLVGLAPLCIVKQWGVRAIQFMGGAANDSNQFVVKKGFETAFADALADVLQETRHAWDAVQLTPTSLMDPVLKALRTWLNRQYMPIAVQPTALPCFDVPPTWDEYWSSIGKKHRRTWSYSRRHLARRGEISFRVIRDAAGLADGIAQMVRLHTANWQSRRQYHQLAPLNRMPKFLETLVSVSCALAARDQAWLGQLCFDDKPMSWLLSFRLDRTLYDYMTAFDHAFAVSSPGVWVSLEMTREAIRQGILTYQVGRGAQLYKFWMGARDVYAEGLCAAQPSPRGLIFSMVHASRDRAARVYHGLRKVTA